MKKLLLTLLLPLSLFGQTETIILDESWYPRKNKWATDDYSYVQMTPTEFFLTERTRGTEYWVQGDIRSTDDPNQFWVIWMNTPILRVHVVRIEDGVGLHLYSPTKRTDRYFNGHVASEKEINKIKKYNTKQR